MRTWQTGDKLNATNLNGAFDEIKPIGSLYYSYGESDPEDLFGGTWEERECDNIIERGAISNSTNATLAICEYVLRANGDMEVYGYTNAYNVASHTGPNIEISLPYTTVWGVVSTFLVSGGNYWADMRYLGYTLGDKIVINQWNDGGSTCENIQMGFRCICHINLTANAIESIHCYERVEDE